MKLPRPTDDDFRQALAMMYLGNWDKLKVRARDVQLRRLIEANQDRQRELCDEGSRLSATDGVEARIAWLKNSEAITKAFDEHDELMRMAYPDKDDGK